MAAKAPQSIEELRHLYISIRNGENETHLTDRALTVLKKMLDEPNETATKSISEIARENNINISSVTRLAQKLGYDGFPGLKNIFRQNVKQRKSFYSEQIRRFLWKRQTVENKESTLLGQVIEEEWSNVMLMADAFDEENFMRGIDLIVRAEKIQIIGLRSSYPLAYFLGFHLKMIRDGVAIIGSAGHTMAEDLSILRPGDLLIAIGVNPYTTDTATACRVARQQGVDVFAITDSVSSPLATETDNYLLTSIQGDYFFSPIAAAIICIETLLSELVKQLGENSLQRLHQTEIILHELGVEI